MTRVQVQGIVKRFGDMPAIDGISLEVRPGELFTLVGPSGCGKTTLLRIIAGLLDQDVGSVLFNEDRMDDVPPYLRNIGVVFQSYAIFPHLTVGENIAYGLKARRVSPDRITAKVAEASHLWSWPGRW
jgi:iron(III) transport system ATP-binding protein